MYRIKCILSGGVPVNNEGWILAEDGSPFETSDLSEAEKAAADCNEELKLQRQYNKTQGKFRFEVVEINPQLGIPQPGRGHN
jgi:hypothetical protein